MAHHHTKTKGDLGVVHAELDLMEKGFQILTPRTEHAPFDFVAYDRKQFVRVQVKYRAAVDGVVTIRFQTSWADRHGTHTRPIPKDEVDVMSVFCPDTRTCYYLDPFRFGESVNLRLTPSRNNQQKGILFADDFRNLPSPLRGIDVLDHPLLKAVR